MHGPSRFSTSLLNITTDSIQVMKMECDNVMRETTVMLDMLCRNFMQMEQFQYLYISIQAHLLNITFADP